MWAWSATSNNTAATDPAIHSSPVFFAGDKSLGSGRRVQGREAIACDAEGALDAAAVTGTLIAEEDGLLMRRQSA
jgi:hypothetical protein